MNEVLAGEGLKKFASVSIVSDLTSDMPFVLSISE